MIINTIVAGGGSSPVLQAKTNISPTTSSQVITADSGYDGLSSVQINAMPSGTMGQPNVSKSSVANHSKTVSSYVTNTAGYIAGGTVTGASISVSASELVSGSETKTINGTYDVTNLAELVVNVPSGIGKLLGTLNIGSVSTSSTSNVSLNKSLTINNINDYDLLVFLTYAATQSTNGRHIGTFRTGFMVGTSAIGTKNGGNLATSTMNIKNSSGTVVSQLTTTPYGVFPYSFSISNGSVTIQYYARYNNSQTGTINGTYTADVYGLKLYELI